MELYLHKLFNTHTVWIEHKVPKKMSKMLYYPWSVNWVKTQARSSQQPCKYLLLLTNEETEEGLETCRQDWWLRTKGFNRKYTRSLRRMGFFDSNWKRWNFVSHEGNIYWLWGYKIPSNLYCGKRKWSTALWRANSKSSGILSWLDLPSASSMPPLQCKHISKSA